jgi:hypothetical protein
MADDGEPGFATRMRAALRGERSAAALETLRDAGTAVYGELAAAEETRSGLLLGGVDMWTATPSVSGHLLATWNAFVLQTLGESLLTADYADRPGTAGYVPPVTFEQTWTWFAAASHWLGVARQARANPGYDPRHHFRVPADLPATVPADPPPAAYLAALLAAARPVRDHVDLALFDLERGDPAEPERADVNALRQWAAEAASAADLAGSVSGRENDERLRRYATAHVEHALRLWYHLGQLAAMPALARGYRPARPPAPAPAVARPTTPARPPFDPWCFTCPAGRAGWRGYPRVHQELAALWAADPEPLRTIALHGEIERALAAGYIAAAQRDGRPLHYYRCPWPSIYRVLRPVRIAGVPLDGVQLFTLHLEAAGGRFIRRVVCGPFSAGATHPVP